MKKIITQMIPIIVVTSLVLSIGIFFGYNMAKQPGSTKSSKVTPKDTDVIFDLVNQERTKAGLKPLQRIVRLDSTAYMKTADMVAFDYFAHEHNNELILEYIREVVPECNKPESEYLAGENLAVTNDLPEVIMAGWMGSKSHREQILEPTYTKSGIALISTDTPYEGHENTTKITQHFCR